MDVYDKDDFKMGADENGNMFVKHSFGTGARGVLIGAYAIIKLKDGSKVIEYADKATYDKGYNTWKTHGGEMLKKVAEVHVAKKVGNIRGVYAEEEFKIQNGIVHTDAMPVKDGGGAMNVLEADVNEKITIEQIDKLMKLAERKGSKIPDILKYFEIEALTEMNPKQFDTLAKMLNKKNDIVADPVEEKKVESDDVVLDAEVEEVATVEKPKTGMDSLRETANKIKNKQPLNRPVQQPTARPTRVEPITGDVAKTVNVLYEKEPSLLSQDEIDLLNDCNSGAFKGKEFYTQVEWLKE
jgi:hypothetical protein